MSKDKKRRISIVLEDVDLEKDTFSFTLQGDCERFGLTDPSLVPTAAEHWGMRFFKACQDCLKTEGDAKRLNREERRRG